MGHGEAWQGRAGQGIKMIISRTPLRISFAGGGTDYPTWYRENRGAVLATTINHYCWLFCRYLPPFFEHRHRIVYRQIELPQTVDEIQHPSVRETLKFMGISEGVEIHHAGDLPARSGMGTSSSFTVGLLHALYALKEIMPTKIQLAKEAIHIEQNLVKENVGSQDQVSAAVGGLNRIDFGPGDSIEVHPVIIKSERLEELQSHLMLLFTGLSRTASQIAEEQIRLTPSKKSELEQMYQMIDEGISILNSDRDIADFGRLLHEGWKLKKSLSSKVAPLYVDLIYEAALKMGAIGGKICGAGGGGFILLFVEPELQDKIREELGLLHVPFRFENEGSRVVFNQ